MQLSVHDKTWNAGYDKAVCWANTSIYRGVSDTLRALPHLHRPVRAAEVEENTVFRRNTHHTEVWCWLKSHPDDNFLSCTENATKIS